MASTDIACTDNAPPALRVGLTDEKSFALSQRVARMFSESSLVPKSFQGNLPNCVIALNMASRMGADPMMVMQNLYVVHGNPSWSAQFMIACFNACGRFTALKYEFRGREGSDDWGCRAFATEKSTGERVEGAWVSIKTAKSEGWFSKNGSKWQTMPEQMLRYRAASWMIRANAPEISMGIMTRDEVEDTYDMQAVDGAYQVQPAQDLNEIIDAVAEPVESPVPSSPSPTCPIDGEPVDASMCAKCTPDSQPPGGCPHGGKA